jgi:pyruvate dehydrogenase E2 component (dihydrolipoamide acetyltransferase)
VVASPLARRLAHELAIDLAKLQGTGRHGRITRVDVEAAHAQAAPPAAAPTPGSPSPVQTPSEPDALSSKGEVEILPLTRLQAVVARRMVEAKASAPEFVLRREVDMEAAVELRETLRSWVRDAPLPSYNEMVVRAAALALRAHPRANGAYRDGRFELYERVNVGFAVAAEDTLLVPTIFDADRKSLGQIAREARDLAARARSGRLTPPELSGGTFSVSNLGMFGVDGFTAVLNPPQAAILAVGALAQRAVVHEGAVVARRRMELSLTCDHRILYGAQAAELLAAIAENLEHPGTLVL